jgi:hypothetical protein
VSEGGTKQLGTCVSWHEALVNRLCHAADGYSFQEIAARTGTNHETVRRYMLHGRVPATFICAFCRAFEVEPTWLLMGHGSMRSEGQEKGPPAFRHGGPHEEERKEATA